MNNRVNIFSALIGGSLVLSPVAYANSYLDMLTTPPQGHISDLRNNVIKQNNNSGCYDDRDTVKFVITGEQYNKYMAYKNAERNNFYSFSLRDTLQDTIYFLETLAMGKFIYELYDK